MSDSVRPHRQQPTKLHRPWDSPDKNTGVGCHFFFQCMKVKVRSLSRVRLFATPWTAAYQAPLSMGFSRQEYWSGLPLPSPSKYFRIAQITFHHQFILCWLIFLEHLKTVCILLLVIWVKLVDCVIQAFCIFTDFCVLYHWQRRDEISN